MQTDSADSDDVKITTEEPTGARFKVYCRSCGNSTNHVALKSVLAERLYDQDPNIKLWQRYQIIQCQGCEILSLLAIDGESTINKETGKPYEQWDVFPARNHPAGRRLVDGWKTLPKQLKQIYTESMEALNRDQPILCGLGIRAVVETVANERGAKGKNLQDRIDDLVTLNVLTKSEAGILHKIRTLGNKAAHEATAHSERELALAMDVIDHLLNAVYILSKRTAQTFK